MRPNEANMAAPKPTLSAVLEKENLNKAWRAVRVSKGAPGPDGRDIEQTMAQIRKHWESIDRKLRAGDYKPGPVRAVTIPKPNGGERTLGVPNVQDRWIQQAIHQKLSERCEPFFSEHSYGFRPNRSAHDAVRAGQKFVQSGKRYVVDIDLKSFFDEVDHDKLMQLVGHHVEDKSLKQLIGGSFERPYNVPMAVVTNVAKERLKADPSPRYWQTSTLTHWTRNWKNGVCRSCAMPTTLRSLYPVPGRRSVCLPA